MGGGAAKPSHGPRPRRRRRQNRRSPRPPRRPRRRLCLHQRRRRRRRRCRRRGGRRQGDLCPSRRARPTRPSPCPRRPSRRLSSLHPTATRDIDLTKQFIDVTSIFKDSSSLELNASRSLAMKRRSWSIYCASYTSMYRRFIVVYRKPYCPVYQYGPLLETLPGPWEHRSAAVPVTAPCSASIIGHCSSTARGVMAYKILKSH